MKPRTAARPALEFLRDALGNLERDGLLRSASGVLISSAIEFCSNDYLGLAERSPVDAPAGAGASRLVSGDRQEHRDLERALADWLGVEDALAFTSGYAANVGVLSALAGPGDRIISDTLNHASIIDGARLSRATVVVVPHVDLSAVARALAVPHGGRTWVVTESYFSMDADAPDLRGLRALCDRAGSGLVVDEAHALGILGPEGRGLCAEAEIVPDVLVGTFGKSFGAAGAFVAGCADLRTWLWNRARSFVFSTGLAPSCAASAQRSLATMRAEPERRTATLARAAQLRGGLASLGIAPRGFGQIVPWVLGDPGKAVRYARAITERGALVQAIRPPSVPKGTARLRMTVTARHTEADVARLLGAIEEAMRCEER